MKRIVNSTKWYHEINWPAAIIVVFFAIIFFGLLFFIGESVINFIVPYIRN